MWLLFRLEGVVFFTCLKESALHRPYRLDIKADFHRYHNEHDKPIRKPQGERATQQAAVQFSLYSSSQRVKKVNPIHFNENYIQLSMLRTTACKEKRLKGMWDFSYMFIEQNRAWKLGMSSTDRSTVFSSYNCRPSNTNLFLLNKLYCFF